MKTLEWWLSMLGAVTLFTGCASGPKFTDYKPQPAPPGMSHIWFFRHAIFFGDGAYSTVKVDGVPQGHIFAGHFFDSPITPGLHEVSTTTEVKKAINVNVFTNQDCYVEFYVVPGAFIGHVVPTELTETNALRSMSKLTYEK